MADQRIGEEAWRYGVDAWERTVLVLDALRERADTILRHEAAGLPPVLTFGYETILDARQFEPPANYALLRIIPPPGCMEACAEGLKRPVIVLDPRAGHGPGIGGAKRESEVGVALHEGHPLYFVSFFPDPCPGQTIADVLGALRRFVDDVARRHPAHGAPILYGNCQAGWAVTLLSAHCGGVPGPAVLNGSPLSYWAGEAGVNTMRLLGGLVGGTWLTHWLADLGHGVFDGAWLVQNFENLNPVAVWDKYADLFAGIDDERERFLEFERWWNGFFGFSREEILAIVENLFVGNRLEQGTVRICGDCLVDLRRIRNPLVIFASRGDTITPPHQALAWLAAVYGTTAALKAAGQRIVYILNEHVGHLGIFVSAKVARLEHRAILEHVDELEALAPGLYEMVILYRMFVSPWVQLVVAPWTAAALKWLHPMRTSRYMYAEALNPWMLGVAALPESIHASRHRAAADNPFLALERESHRSVSASLDAWRRTRDRMLELTFTGLYGG